MDGNCDGSYHSLHPRIFAWFFSCFDTQLYTNPIHIAIVLPSTRWRPFISLIWLLYSFKITTSLKLYISIILQMRKRIIKHFLERRKGSLSCRWYVFNPTPWQTFDFEGIKLNFSFMDQVSSFFILFFLDEFYYSFPFHILLLWGGRGSQIMRLVKVLRSIQETVNLYTLEITSFLLKIEDIFHTYKRTATKRHHSLQYLIWIN